MMLTPADVATAIINKWASLGLDVNIPGSIKTGRRVPQQPGSTGSPLQEPYATVEVRPAGDNELYTDSGTAGGPYWRRFAAQIILYGIGEIAISNLIRLIGNSFDDQQWTIPNGTFQFAWPENFTLEEVPERKQGEDWWQGSITYDVGVSGFL